jgi:ATP-dependent Clp protease protease subunit
MQLVRPEVSTICVGLAASAGTVLLCAGAKGKRYTLPNATVQMHQAMGGASGEATSVEIAARELLRVQDTIRKIISKHTGQPMDKIAHDTDRDLWLSAEQAVEYGIVDQILSGPASKKELLKTRDSAKQLESKKADLKEI